MSSGVPSKHKKYFGNGATNNANNVNQHVAAASSTGTMDSLLDGQGIEPNSNKGSENRSTPDNDVGEFGYSSEEEGPSRISLVNDTFEPLSDLSMSSRDIRR